VTAIAITTCGRPAAAQADVEQHDDAPVPPGYQGHAGVRGRRVAEVIRRIAPAPLRLSTAFTVLIVIVAGYTLTRSLPSLA